ncbi:hypothetical protein OIE66_07700 [Nonomuraea sp. NBC_01738]|uniref:hypothetical protein n=1 Tax=Nonomuraea sp. NBC_01738 TaxID=2976003 RepID=UPI002E0DC797|nr:hypothetical protein OIE66_07700 [Nonomuraea sp. NBC_01738]
MTIKKRVLGAAAVLAVAAATLSVTTSAQASSYAKQYWVTTFGNAPAYAYDDHGRWRSTPGTLYAGRSFVYCKIWRNTPYSGAQGYNHYFILTELDAPKGKEAFIPAYFLSNWGNDQAKLDDGRTIPNC